MEVAIPYSNPEFDFNTARSSPYLSAPSSPKGFGSYFHSAPTSPTHMLHVYREFDHFSMTLNDNYESKLDDFPSSSIRFIREDDEDSVIPSEAKKGNGEDDDFKFDLNKQLENDSLSADELFDGGKIRSLKPPPSLNVGNEVQEYTTTKTNRIIQIQDVDPIAAAKENAQKQRENERGRYRIETSSTSSSGRRRDSRSLSPRRVSAYPWEEEQKKQDIKQLPSSLKATSSSAAATTNTTSKGSKKWRLKDFLLFRSAPEGRATDKKDCFGKYPALFRKQEDLKPTSVRSSNISGFGSPGPGPAYKPHHTANTKNRTYLPYKQGILGRWAFKPVYK